MKKKEQYLIAAKACGMWFVTNQIIDTNDANHGRFVAELVVKTGDVTEWSTNWTTGMAIQSLLMLAKRTGDEQYLEAAKRAAEYILSLQIRDGSKNDGFIREISPQTDWCHPRDALSAAWGLLQLGRYTKNMAYIDAAIRYGNWFAKEAMHEQYPAWTCYVDERAPDHQLGSFHGGSPLFFFDLADATGNQSWIKRVALPILDTYLNTFTKKDGSIYVVVDPQTRHCCERQKSWQSVAGWVQMHRYNDDFASFALMRAYQVTGQQHYLDGALKFLNWTRKGQNQNGSFGTPPVHSANASLIMEFLDAYQITNDSKWLTAARDAGKALLALQERKKRQARNHGGFYGMYGLNKIRPRHVLHIRTSCYALAALLRLEQGAEYECYCGYLPHC